VGGRAARGHVPLSWLVADVAVLWVSFVLAFALRFLGRFPIHNVDAFLRSAPWVTLAWLALATVYGLYERRRPWREIRQGILLTTAVGTVLAMAISFFDRGFAFPRSVLLLAAVLNVVLGIAARRVIWRREFVRGGRARAWLACRAGEREALAAAVVRAGEDLRVRLEGDLVWTEGDQPGAWIAALRAALSEGRAEALFLSGGLPVEVKESAALAAVGAGLTLHLIPSLYEVLLAHAHAEQLEDALALRLAGAGPISDYEMVKRVMDLGIGGALLLVLSPLLAVIAAAVAVCDGRPVLYVQERLGRDGQVFRMWKFRTMVRDAERETGPTLAASDDPRSTALGRLLRAYRLDELPQLWNVLRGEMSLVGPRPERPDLHRAIAADVPGFEHRLQVAPGLTGLAQINGRYDTLPAEKLKHDLAYSVRSSPLADLRILLRTLRVLLPVRAPRPTDDRRRGASGVGGRRRRLQG
jgi:exopolysaccharide biosynthesis polyprenyl glycosylphosphotransferase